MLPSLTKSKTDTSRDEADDVLLLVNSIKPEKSLTRKFMVFSLSNKYVSGGLFTCAASFHLLTMTGNYIENNFGARAGWALPVTCDVTDHETNKTESYGHQIPSGERYGAVMLNSPRAVLLKCAEVLNHKDFKMASAHLTFGLSMKGVYGIDGKIGSEMGGYGTSFGPDQKEEAIRKFNDLSYYALQRRQQLTGQALTSDWYLYQTLRAGHKATELAAAIKDNIIIASDQVIDNTIQGLNGLKSKPVSIANKDKAPSPL